jgi:hypothetical protein
MKLFIDSIHHIEFGTHKYKKTGGLPTASTSTSRPPIIITNSNSAAAAAADADADADSGIATKLQLVTTDSVSRKSQHYIPTEDQDIIKKPQLQPTYNDDSDSRDESAAANTMNEIKKSLRTSTVDRIIDGGLHDESDTYTKDIDLVKTLNSKNSKNLDIIILFIQKFVHYIIAIQERHDEITIDYIKTQSAKFLQHTQQYNLRVKSILEGNEEERSIIMAKMKLKDISWADLHSEYIQRHSDYNTFDAGGDGDPNGYNIPQEEDYDADSTPQQYLNPNDPNYDDSTDFANNSDEQLNTYIGDDNNLADIMDSYDSC